MRPHFPGPLPMQTTRRYRHIDVLRGLAALLVVYQHTAELMLNPDRHINAIEESILGFFTRVIGIGEVGVCIFLMISGFVVPFSLLKYTSSPLRKFAAHRFFRLYPAYWLSVPLGVIFVYWQFGVQHGGRDIHWPTVLANFTMLQSFFGFNDIMGQYWTLALELLFYTLCALLFHFRRLYSFGAALTVLFAVTLLKLACKRLLPEGSHLFNELAMFQYLGFMFFGIFYRRYLLEHDKRAGLHAIVIIALTMMSFGALADIKHFIGGEQTALKMPLTHLAAFAVFVGFTRFYQPSNRPGVFLGKISYSIYLFHPVVFYPLLLYWFPFSPFHAWPHVFILASMALSILAATLTYYAIEAPFVAMGARIFPGEKGGAAPLPQKTAEALP